MGLHVRWSLSVSGHTPGTVRRRLRGARTHGPLAASWSWSADSPRAFPADPGGRDVRKPRKELRQQVLAFAHEAPRLVSCRLGLGQHYREAVPSYCGNLAEYQYAPQQNLLRQLLNIFATHS